MAEGVKLTRKELYERVWSQPMRTLAKEFGLSDVGLKKTCKRYDIPTPGVGYWAKVEHGKPVQREKLPPTKRGEVDTIVIKPEALLHPWQVSSDANPDWVHRESLPENQVRPDFSGELLHPLVRDTTRRLNKLTGNAWLVPPHGCLNLRVSREQLPRAAAILDALLRACETRGWQIAVEVPLPRRRHSSGNIWHPDHGWLSHMPTERHAETGVLIRGQFVAFSLTEAGRQAPPTDAEVKAWRKQFPYGIGGPPPRSVPNGELTLEIASHPWVSTRRRFRDSPKKPLGEQLNAVIVALVRMAAGLRNYALKQAVEERKKRLTERRRRDEELRRKRLEANIAHLENGIERWRWRTLAREFLAFAKSESARRNIDEAAFAEWFAWAEEHVEDRGINNFFNKWT